MKKTVLIFTLLAVLAITAYAQEEITEPGIYARMETSAGTMVFKLDYENTPMTVLNFMALADGMIEGTDRSGAYYEGLNFYKDIEKYAVFSGDAMGNGTGSPGYSFPREEAGVCTAGEPGTLVMNGLIDQTDGSHFFIMKTSDAFLDTKYTPFGKMISGEKVLNKIGTKDTILKITFSRIGDAAEAFDVSMDKFNELKAIQKKKSMELLKEKNPVLYNEIEKLGPDFSRSPAGTYYSITKEGSGKKPVKGQMIQVHYVGRLLDGTEFDNSRKRGQSFDLVLGEQQVIPGWVEVLMDMKAGEIRTVIIPPEMAYGSVRVGPIPANSWLVFEIEVLGIR